MKFLHYSVIFLLSSAAATGIQKQLRGTEEEDKNNVKNTLSLANPKIATATDHGDKVTNWITPPARERHLSPLGECPTTDINGETCTMPNSAGTLGCGYKLNPGYRPSPGTPILASHPTASLAQLKSYCNANPACVQFDSTGNLYPNSGHWNFWWETCAYTFRKEYHPECPNSDIIGETCTLAGGLGTHACDYNQFPGHRPSPGTPIIASYPDAFIHQLAAYCNANPSCKQFDSAGNLYGNSGYWFMYESCPFTYIKNIDAECAPGTVVEDETCTLPGGGTWDCRYSIIEDHHPAPGTTHISSATEVSYEDLVDACNGNSQCAQIQFSENNEGLAADYFSSNNGYWFWYGNLGCKGTLVKEYVYCYTGGASPETRYLPSDMSTDSNYSSGVCPATVTVAGGAHSCAVTVTFGGVNFQSGDLIKFTFGSWSYDFYAPQSLIDGASSHTFGHMNFQADDYLDGCCYYNIKVVRAGVVLGESGNVYVLGSIIQQDGSGNPIGCISTSCY